MTGRHLLVLRTSLGMERVEFARALGYVGKPANLKRLIRRYEQMRDHDIPQAVCDRVVSYEGSEQNDARRIETKC